LTLIKRVPRHGALELYYTTIVGPSITNRAWGPTPAIRQASVVGAAVDELGSIVTRAAQTGGFDDAEAHLSRSPLSLDRREWSEVARELDALNLKLQKMDAASRSASRTAGGRRRC